MDFITAGPPNSNQCSHNLQTAMSVCQTLGLPLHPNKCIGPSTRLVVLGIKLASLEQCAHLTEDKLLALRELISFWHSLHWCNSNQLESLIGHLHHAAKVVWPGRTFLRDRPSLLLLMPGPFYLFELRISFGSSVVAGISLFLAWHELLAFSRHIHCNRFRGHLRCCWLLRVRCSFEG